MNGNKIRILIADDQTLFREGIKVLLELQPDMELAGEACDGVEAIDLACALQPDVLLLDLKMPRKDGLAALREIAERCPSIHILVLTSFADDERMFPAVKAGALGYLLKDAPRDQFLRAIREVALGHPFLYPAVAFQVLRELNQPAAVDPLTERELETLRLLARGLSNEEIAEQLRIQQHTVGKYVSNILIKLHLANRTQAALYALRHKLTHLDEGEN
ncbi:MAG: response regulator transcription factor [Chloroflexi bacterium]|nr:response regulator transcription factor [Chloroflexota bacterium]MBI5082568.1 response regulator transcription factor [Chloroflexota bacterium]MBI5350601.1 response regulator transcription factor [Chloroflexota bacterium]MBI5713571.1 response regulator transcription factor [Chloroflexota bacterium]